MNTKYKILIATDYSEAVMNAERYAVQFAKKTNSTLTLMHVYEFPIPSPGKATIFEQEMKSLAKSQMAQLLQHKNKLFSSLNIKENELTCNCVVSEGNTSDQIRKEGEEYDFIIIGTHGEGGFQAKIFGSHSWDVIKKTNIPVIAVPKDGMFTGIKNIVFATEYREGEIPVIDFITSFAKDFDAGVTVLHVTNYPLSKKFGTLMFEKFRDIIKEKISYPKLEMRLIKNENIDEGLNKYCSENKVDLLVMSPEKLSILEKIFFPVSITRKMSFLTKVPLMSIPDFYNHESGELSEHAMNRDFVKVDF